jgi:hypothetical protein
LVYQQLARHREQIEAEVARIGDLSLRAARRLIAGPRRGGEKKKKTPALLDHWKCAFATERTTFLDAIGIDGIRKAASLDLFRQLRERARVEKVDSSPDTAITSLIVKALSHITTADAPQTTKPVADGNINEALNSLRAAIKKLGASQHTYHDIAVAISAAKARTRRAA